MKLLRNVIAWTFIEWALRVLHSDDPIRPRVAEFVIALTQWQVRYDADEIQRRDLQRAWKKKLERS